MQGSAAGPCCPLKGGIRLQAVQQCERELCGMSLRVNTPAVEATWLRLSIVDSVAS